MVQQLVRSFFSRDPYENQGFIRSNGLKRFLLITLLIITAFGAIFLYSTSIPTLTIVVVLTLDAVVLITILALHFGHEKLAFFLFTLTLWAVTTFAVVYLHGGVSSPAIGAYLLLITASGLMLGSRTGIFFSFFCLLTVLCVSIAEVQGLLPPPLVSLDPVKEIYWHALIFILASVLVRITAGSIYEALECSRRNEQILIVKNRELEETRISQERSISQRADALAASEEKFRALFENVMDGVYQSTPSGKVITANLALVQMLGYNSADELLSVNIAKDIYADPMERDKWLRNLHEKGVNRNAELHLRRKNGDILIALENSFAVRDEQGSVLYYEGTLTDITERKLTEELYEFLATHDPLTGLPNRSLFQQNLAKALQQSTEDECLAVLFADMDGFKSINDLYGHDQGDLLLQEMAILLKKQLRKGDMVARMGGDEFVFLFRNVLGKQEASAIAARILSDLSKPLELNGNSFSVTFSIGISLYPQNGTDAESLVRCADKAMYRVKELGKNNYGFI